MAKIIVSCEHCKREIERYPSQILKTVFCSKLCRSEYNIKNNTIAFNCLHCGEEKRVRKSSYKNNENHFCCRKCKDEWQKESLKGESNPFYERTHSKLTKESISKTKKSHNLKGENAHNYNTHTILCSECGKETYKIKYLINRSKHNFCSVSCHGVWKSKNLTGENSPNYNFDLTYEERQIGRNYTEYSKFVKDVLIRDEYTCQHCSIKGGKLNVHHINGYDWDKVNRTNIHNGITLCVKCHTLFHKTYGYGNNTINQFRLFMQ